MPLLSRLAATAAVFGAAALSIPSANAWWGPWDRDRYYGPGYGYAPYGPYRHHNRGWGNGWGDTYGDIWDDMLGDMDMDFEVNFRTRGLGRGLGHGRGYGDYYDRYRHGYGYGPYYRPYYGPYAPVPANPGVNTAE